MTKHLFAQTISDKVFDQGRGAQWNWTGDEGFDICFSIFFDCYWKSLNSGVKTGHWAMSPPKFETFLIFTNSLSRSTTRDAARLPKLLY